jgi:hypothetical protein
MKERCGLAGFIPGAQVIAFNCARGGRGERPGERGEKPLLGETWNEWFERGTAPAVGALPKWAGLLTGE